MIRFDDIVDKLSAKHSEQDLIPLKKAYVFAARAHQGQVRRSGEPYLSHPLEVTSMLADMNMDITTLTAGLLHDILEDTEVGSGEIREAFGRDVADLVDGVTKISRMEESSPETRKAESIRKIILAMTDDLRVIFIKLADRVHNLKTLKFLPEEKQRSIAHETLEIYALIANRLGMGRIKTELEDLSFRYVDPDNYFHIASLVDPLRKKAETELKKTKKVLEGLMREHKIPAEIFTRIKGPYSIHNKMERQNIDFSQVYDFMALRVITDTIQNCYAALGVIHQHWPHLPHRFRDLISMPKPNLYQSLHTTVITENKQTVEIQVRTREMNDLTENGISAHWRYKETDPQAIMKEDLRLRWLREIVELYKEHKSPQEFLRSLKADLVPDEIYAFTPKGKAITLPAAASVLDFAFRIHTEIGLHAKGATVNGKQVPLKTPLKTGDIVEVLTSTEKTPRREWLNMVVTSTARHNLTRWLNLQERMKNTALGKKLWNKEIGKYRLPPERLKERALLKRLSDHTDFRIKKLDDFYSLVGFGKIVLTKSMMERLFSEEHLAKRKDTLIEKVVKRVTPRTRAEIRVKDTLGGSVNMARCCSPIHGEPIVGYITAGKGVTVHALRCPLVAKEVLDPQRMVDVAWDSSAKGLYTGKLLIKSVDTPGVLAKLTTAIAEGGGDITKAEVNTSEDQKAQVKLALKIRDIKQLDNIMRKVSGIKEVLSVKRL